MRRVIRLVLAAVLATAAVTATGDAARAALELHVPGRGVVWRAPIAGDEAFAVAFTHSAERARWVHHYRAAAGAIQQEGSTFAAFGAGMPSASAGGAPLVPVPDGWFAAAPLRIGELRMINWRPAGLTLHYRGRDVAIGRFVEDFERFELRIR